MRASLPSWLPALALATLLSACGGGGSGGDSGGVTPPAPPPSSPAVVRGVASVGAPLGGATVRVVDAKGTALGSATTHPTDGSYSLTLSSATPTLPLMLQARARDAAGQWVLLHTVLTEATAGSTVTAHITPLTQAHAALLLGGNPHAAFVQPAEGPLASLTSAQSLAASDFLKTLLKTPLADLKLTASSLNLISDSGFATPKSGADLLLEAVRVQLDGAQANTLTLASKLLVVPAAEVVVDLPAARTELIKASGSAPANAVTSALKVTAGASIALANAPLLDEVVTQINPLLARAAPADDYKATRPGSTVTDTNAVLYGYERHDGVDTNGLATRLAAWGTAGLQMGPLQVLGCADDVVKTNDCGRVLVASALTDRNGVVKDRLVNAVTYNTTQKRWRLLGNGKPLAMAVRPTSLLRLSGAGVAETTGTNPSAGVAVEVRDGGTTQNTVQAPSSFALPLATCNRDLLCLSTPGASSVNSTGGLLDQYIEATSTSWLSSVDAQRGARYTVSTVRSGASETRRIFLPSAVLLPSVSRHPTLDGVSASAPLTAAGLTAGLTLTWTPWATANPDLRVTEVRIVIRYAAGADGYLVTIDNQSQVRLPPVPAAGTPVAREIWLVAEDVRGQQMLTRYTLL
jgi:hypothetical protein